VTEREWGDACETAEYAHPVEGGTLTTHLVLWRNDASDSASNAMDVSDDGDDERGSTWELWLANITQPTQRENAGITGGLFSECGATMHNVDAIAAECEGGSKSTHPVRVHWWSKIAANSGNVGEMNGSLGSLGRQQVLELAAGTSTDAVDSKFGQTRTYNQVDRRLIGPQIAINKSGTIKARSKLVLEAAVAMLVARGQIG
jgi:hypothetical protein